MKLRQRWAIGSWIACAFAGVASAQPPFPQASLEHLPAQCHSVVAARDLAGLRATPAGQCLERLLAESSPWDRTLAAWNQLATTLRLTPGEAADRLAGAQIVFVAAPAAEAGHPDQYALVGQVSLDTEGLLRKSLRPAPRGIASNKPILALERGAFEVATSVPTPDGPASLLLAPRGSADLFDRMLPVVSGGVAEQHLGSDAWWPRLAELPPAPVIVIHRAGPEFIALAATAREAAVRASLRCSPGLLSSTLGEEGVEPANVPWPEQAIALLESEALLFVAGSPRQQPTPPDAGAPGTLLLALLSNLRLEPELERQLDGVALVAVHPLPGPGEMAVTAAMHVGDVSAFAPAADRHLGQFAGEASIADPAGPLRGVPLTSVRVLTLGDQPLRVFRPGVGEHGSLAWAYEPSGPGAGGWWILSIRTTASEETQSAAHVQRVAAALREQPPAGLQPVFRLVVRPAELLERLSAGSPLKPADSAGAPPSALRWLRRVETVLRRPEPGLVTGEVRLDMNDELLRRP